MVGFLAGSGGWTDVVPYKFAKAVVNGQQYPPPPAPQPQVDPQAAKVPVVIEVDPVGSIPFVEIPMKSRRDRKRWTRYAGSVKQKDGSRAIISYGTYGDYGIEY